MAGSRFALAVALSSAALVLLLPGPASAHDTKRPARAAGAAGRLDVRADATGCVGVAGSRISLLNPAVLVQPAARRTIGGGADAIKVRLTARDVQLTGYANCGPRSLGGDGRNTVEFIDFEWGDWETSTATCQGAAGMFVPASVNAHDVRNMACIRCKSVSCNHGMHFGVSFGSVVGDSSWRAGNPADRTVPLANGQIGLCEYGGPACTMGTGEPEAYTILRNYCDRWPYGDGQ